MTGISKGAGMIKPNMATMLGYLAFDAKVAQPVLDELVKYAADRSFNCITIDGDTSTNDSFILMATGAGALHIDSDRPARTTPPCATPSPASRPTWRSRSSATAKARPSSSPSRWSRAATWKSAARSPIRSPTRRW
jgi:hypothetical protein